MAEIDIQEKRRSPLGWILGLIALVLIVWVAAEMLDGEDEEFATTVPATELQPVEPLTPATPQAGAEVPAEVTAFEEQCSTASTMQDEMSLSHEYTEGCIRQLTAALAAVISRDTVGGTALSQQLEEHRARAEQLTERRQSPEHSSYVREVFTGVAALISRIEETRASAGNTLETRAERVQEAAESLSTDRPVLEQRQEVAGFFNEAAAALRSMATS